MDISKEMKDTAIAITMKFIAGFFKKKITEYCNKYLSNYGRLIDHQLDFENKRVIVTIELKGEKEPFNIIVSDLKVVENAVDYYLKIGNFDVEREWIKLLGQDYLNGKFGNSRINLSEKVGKALSIVLK